MTLIVDEANNECIKLSKECEEFYKVTQVFVRAIRRINHGIHEEDGMMRNKKFRDEIKKKVLPRHEAALKKIIIGLQDYAENFVYMKKQYEVYFSSRKRATNFQLAKVESMYRKICAQRDIVLSGILAVINTQLKNTSVSFQGTDIRLEVQIVFKLIERYNIFLVKLKEIPHFLNENGEEEPSPYQNLMLQQLLPERVMSKCSQFKRLTASKILQISGIARACLVTKTVSSALFSSIKFPLEENGTRLPWKPIFYDGLTTLPQVDIFEEAIAKEEVEYERNQRKLNMALKLEFGDDFPAADYLPVSSTASNLPSIDSEEMDELVKTNAKLLELLLKRFLLTAGVLGTYIENFLSKIYK